MAAAGASSNARWVVHHGSGFSVDAISPDATAVTYPYDESPQAVKEVPYQSVKKHIVSENAQYLLFSTDFSATVVDLDTGELLCKVPINLVEELAISPKGTFLATYSVGVFASKKDEAVNVSKDVRLSDPKFAQKLQTTRYVTNAAGESVAQVSTDAPKENLVIWRVADGQQMVAFSQRDKDGWEPQWSADDDLCIRITNNTIHIYKNKSFTSEAHSSVRLDSVACVGLAPSTLNLVSFASETKSSPAAIRFSKIHNPTVAISQKTFYRAKFASVKWNNSGKLAVVKSTLSGESSIHLASEKAVVKVAIDDAYIHEYSWSCNDQFVVSHGPAQGYRTSLFASDGSPLFYFGGNSINRGFAQFSADGHRLLLAGLFQPTSVIEIWQVSFKASDWKRVSSFETTLLSYIGFLTGDGTRLLTATTSRYPTFHGYRIWDDKGKTVLQHELRMLDDINIVPPKKPQVQTVTISSPASASSSSAAVATVDEDVPTTPEEIDKKIRNLRKKLRQIEPLKEKQRLGITLEENQLVKINSEAGLLDEISVLTNALASLGRAPTA